MKWKPLFLLTFLLADTLYSFWQHYHVALEGDLAAIVLPADWYAKVLENPFGEAALLHGEQYGGVNRFFAHWSMSVYLKNVPLWLQTFVSPVESLYLACGLLKIAVQLAFIGILSAYMPVRKRPEILLTAALFAPLFQTFGYNGTMGLIEKSITYTFFYSLPVCALLLYLLPFYRRYYLKNNEKWTLPVHIGLGLLSVALPLSGPLIPATILLISSFLLVFVFFHQPNNRILRDNSWLFFYLFIAGIFSIYSFRLSSYNVDNQAVTLPVLQRYQQLIEGIGSIFTRKIGLPLLAIAAIAQTLYIQKYTEYASKKQHLRLLKWMAVFCITYVLLLPLGGYRGYRPLIIRHDTIIPITVCLTAAYVMTNCLLLRYLQGKRKVIFASAAVGISVIFTLADEPQFYHNACEKAALETLSQATGPVVLLGNECTVMSWNLVTKPDDSDTNARLLYHWRVTNQVRQYFQPAK
jgi:hypothetical protein